MYPFEFRPKGGFVDNRKIFIAMPFADEFEFIFKKLIEPAINKIRTYLKINLDIRS